MIIIQLEILLINYTQKKKLKKEMYYATGFVEQNFYFNNYTNCSFYNNNEIIPFASIETYNDLNDRSAIRIKIDDKVKNMIIKDEINNKRKVN